MAKRDKSEAPSLDAGEPQGEKGGHATRKHEFVKNAEEFVDWAHLELNLPKLYEELERRLYPDRKPSPEEEAAKARKMIEKEEFIIRRFNVIREFVELGIEFGAKNPKGELYQTAKELSDLMDTIDLPNITDYQKKKYKTLLNRLYFLLDAHFKKRGGKQRKPTAKGKKTEPGEKRFQHWEAPCDACFIIEDNRIKFHYKDEIKDLKLKSESNTHRLLLLIRGGSLRPAEIKDEICRNTTNKASKVVDYANKLLNEKIAEVGFVGIPSNIEFIERDKFGHYSASLKICEKEELEDMQFQSN